MEGANNQLNVSTTLTVSCGGVGNKFCDYQVVSCEVSITAIWWWVFPVEDDCGGVDCSASCIQWWAGGNYRYILQACIGLACILMCLGFRDHQGVIIFPLESNFLPSSGILMERKVLNGPVPIAVAAATTCV